MSPSSRPSNRTSHWLNSKLIHVYKNKALFPSDEASVESFLNVAVSIFVVAFISYQMVALVPKSTKKDNKDVKVLKKVKNQTDRGCDEDSYFSDLHEYVFNEKEVHYSVPFMHETEMLRSSQYFYEQMKLRRSVRSFSSKSVPMKIVQNIIKTAGCSPSVCNAQPWKFCVVIDEKKKAEIRSIIEADARENYVRRNGEGSEWVMGVSQLQETWRRPYLTDAPLLLVVCHEVAPSSAWQEARQGVAEKTARPFDWTFTSKYAGTISGCTVEPSDEAIDLERLKRQEPIGFYSQVTLYEDELADHGTTQMSVRLRVMPGFFFVLMRFYLRIDRVIVRVCDTRVVGDNDKDYVIREWSLREAKVAALDHLPSEVLLDGNQVWASLPILEMRNEKITPTAN